MECLSVLCAVLYNPKAYNIIKFVMWTYCDMVLGGSWYSSIYMKQKHNIFVNSTILLSLVASHRETLFSQTQLNQNLLNIVYVFHLPSHVLNDCVKSKLGSHRNRNDPYLTQILLLTTNLFSPPQTRHTTLEINQTYFFVSLYNILNLTTSFRALRPEF